MGHIDRDERARGKAVVPVTTRRPTQPDPSNPFAKFMTDRTFAQAVKGNIPNKPNPLNSGTRPIKPNPLNSSTRPVNDFVTANDGSRGPDSHSGGANGGTVFVDKPLPPSQLPLRFGSFESSLPNTGHQTLESKQTTSPSLPAETSISSSDIPKLQRFIKLAIVAGRLRIKCTKCGNSIQHCCEQAILEAVSSLPPTYFSS